MSGRAYIRVGALVLVLANLAAGAPAKSDAGQAPPATQPAVEMGVAKNPGGMEVRIKRAYIDQLPLRKKNSTTAAAAEEGLVSDDKFLILELEITNQGKEPLNYSTANGTGGKYDFASVMEGPKRYLTLALFGDLEPLEMTAKATLKPGDKIKDVVAFVPPKDTHARLLLLFPSRNLGDKGKLIIPFTVAGAQ